MTRRATIRRQPERAEQAACLKILRLLGAEVYVLGTTRKRGDHPGTVMTPGLPDLYAFLPMGPPPAAVTPWPLWIEVKAPGGRLSLEQRGFRTWCELSGHRHFSGTAEDLLRYLRGLGYWTKLRT